MLGPLLVFIPQLVRVKRTGLREYGVLAQRYVREFDHKWLRGGAAADEPLVGSGDIQSLADLGNSFEVIRTMRVVPFTKETLLLLLVTTFAPVLPLTLTMVPPRRAAEATARHVVLRSALSLAGGYRVLRGVAEGAYSYGWG